MLHVSGIHACRIYNLPDLCCQITNIKLLHCRRRLILAQDFFTFTKTQ
ncbi:hypothetical protein A1OE_495 [Candidatus Endolissoclinum faulkneri L2]|uniref:Uncharacterized protein n=1 Tax=Candidatus Endolissoclinum faulkneri L2 TaxID=1193729 RepID=K7Z3V9_9PROT|nr:hypothetical protein A1OE_495 [Candidatus Endolissoclinum faulkneri L2]